MGRDFRPESVVIAGRGGTGPITFVGGDVGHDVTADAVHSADDNDVSGHDTTSTRARILASNTVVVLVSHVASRHDTGRDRVVMLATGADRATTVAAASLHNSITVVFHG